MSIIHHLRPLLYTQSFLEIPYETLIKQGIQTLFFDLDNTVMSYDEQFITESHIQFLKQLEETFHIVIVSNSGYHRVSRACHHAQLNFIHSAKKPLRSGYKRAIKKANANIETSLFIGDQLMTDVLGASRMNIKSILVRPLKQRSDHILTRTNRKIERFLLKKISKSYPELMTKALIEYGRDIHGLFTNLK